MGRVVKSRKTNEALDRNWRQIRKSRPKSSKIEQSQDPRAEMSISSVLINAAVTKTNTATNGGSTT